MTSISVYLDSGAVMPDRAYHDDAGLDLYSREPAIVPAYDSFVFDTGVHVHIPSGYAGLIVSKSGLNINHGLTSDGLVDASYTGSIRVKLYNHTPFAQKIEAGQKISQLVIIPFLPVDLRQTFTPLTQTERGSNGFGSSGRFKHDTNEASD